MLLMFDIGLELRRSDLRRVGVRVLRREHRRRRAARARRARGGHVWRQRVAPRRRLRRRDPRGHQHGHRRPRPPRVRQDPEPGGPRRLAAGGARRRDEPAPPRVRVGARRRTEMARRARSGLARGDRLRAVSFLVLAHRLLSLPRRVSPRRQQVATAPSSSSSASPSSAPAGPRLRWCAATAPCAGLGDQWRGHHHRPLAPRRGSVHQTKSSPTPASPSSFVPCLRPRASSCRRPQVARSSPLRRRPQRLLPGSRPGRGASTIVRRPLARRGQAAP